MALRPPSATFPESVTNLDEQSEPYGWKGCREFDLAEGTTGTTSASGPSGFKPPKYSDDKDYLAEFQNTSGYQSVSSDRARAYFYEAYNHSYLKNVELYNNKVASYTITGDSVSQSHTGTSNSHSHIGYEWLHSTKKDSYSKSKVENSGSHSTTDNSYSVSRTSKSLREDIKGIDVCNSLGGTSVSTSMQGAKSSFSLGVMSSSVGVDLGSFSASSKAFDLSVSDSRLTASYTGGHKVSGSDIKESGSKTSSTVVSETHKTAAIGGITLFSTKTVESGNLPNYTTLATISGLLLTIAHIVNTAATGGQTIREMKDIGKTNFNDQARLASTISGVTLGTLAGLIAGVIGGALIKSKVTDVIKKSTPTKKATGAGLRLTNGGAALSFGYLGVEGEAGWDAEASEEAPEKGDAKIVYIDEDEVLLRFSKNVWLKLSEDGIVMSGNVKIEGSLQVISRTPPVNTQGAPVFEL